MEELDAKTISKRSIQGIFALASRSLFLQIINFGAFIVISSILSARELGIYTAVIAIQRVLSFLTDFGLGAALIQKKEELKREDLVTTFTIQAGITLSIFLIVFFLRDQISLFFKLNEQGENLLIVLVFTIFLSSFKTIPSILLERHIKFGRLVLPQIAESLIFNIILIVLVLREFGIDGYSWAFLASSLIGIPLYYLISPWRPGVGVDRVSLTSLRYGAQFQAKNILATIKDDFLTVILVKFLSFVEIGYIGFAQRMAFFVYRYVVDSVTKVTFSSYSRIQDQKEFLSKAIEKSLFFISLLIFPLLTGLIIVSPYIIDFFPRWNNKWEPAIISLIFFLLNAIISSLSSVLVNVLDASGRVKTTLKLMVFWTILTWVLTPIAIYLFGFNGVAIASFLVTSTILLTIYLVKKVVDFAFIKSIYKPVISTVIMAVVTYGLVLVFAKDLISLFFVIILGGLTYVLSITILARTEIVKDFKKLI